MVSSYQQHLTLFQRLKKQFCQRLFDLKLPDNYGSNIANCVDIKACKITGLKSHDCHMLMQQYCLLL